jgi:hypothetical protein
MERGEVEKLSSNAALRVLSQRRLRDTRKYFVRWSE